MSGQRCIQTIKFEKNIFYSNGAMAFNSEKVLAFHPNGKEAFNVWGNAFYENGNMAYRLDWGNAFYENSNWAYDAGWGISFNESGGQISNDGSGVDLKLNSVMEIRVAHNFFELYLNKIRVIQKFFE